MTGSRSAASARSRAGLSPGDQNDSRHFAAGNPLSAVFWSSAEVVLGKIDDGDATVGDVRMWLEATGTEPVGIIGLHVWDEQSERSQLAAEMHTRLVSHLEDRLAADEIDPDLLAAGDLVAYRAHIALQERWMTSALPDGRVPMDVLLDEKDEEFRAEWDAADAEALSTIEAVLARIGDRPLPYAELRAASERLREDIGEQDDQGEEFDELGMEGLSLPVTTLWHVLGAIEGDDCLTAVGWWGLPEAMRPIWAPSDGTPG